jgi:hypothetical protein
MKLDLNVYPDSYPVFSRPRQYLARNHIANANNQHFKPNYISHSPGFKRDVDLRQLSYFPPLLDSEAKPESALGNYQISHYPTSPLNPELEEQCMMLELFRNISRLDFRKGKNKTPTKFVRKVRKIKFDGGISNFHNFLAFASREIPCEECSMSKCICGNTEDLKGKKEIKSVGVNTAKADWKSRYTGEMSSLGKKGKKVEQQFPAIRITKRKKPVSLDLNSLKRDLVITPILK